MTEEAMVAVDDAVLADVAKPMGYARGPIKDHSARADIWNDERVELLKREWLRGASAGDIARLLHAGFTRSAVLGKVYRLGLGKRKMTGPSNPNALNLKVKRIARRVEGKTKRKFTHIEKVKVNCGSYFATKEVWQPEELLQSTAEFDNAIPLTQRKALVELEHQHCRWPVGDPLESGFFFCGAANLGDGVPYCAFHRNASISNAQRLKEPSWRPQPMETV